MRLDPRYNRGTMSSKTHSVFSLISRLWPHSRRVLCGIKTYTLSISSIRSGSRVSRIGRHIFEFKHTKKILGSHLALLAIASAFVPTVTPFSDAFEQNVYAASEINLNTDISIRNPLEYMYINQSYHFFHAGIDFEGITGDPVYPIMDGIVESVEYSYYAYGNSVVIDHQNGYKSRYAHLSRIHIQKGERVDTLDIIGEVGSTGRSTGDHLHLEVYQNGRNINPLGILPEYN